MMNARVTGLRNVELGVPDLDKAAAFYRNVWGLEDVVSTADTLHLRGTGGGHSRADPAPAAEGDVPRRAFRRRQSRGGQPGSPPTRSRRTARRSPARPAALPRDEGGGYGCAMTSPEGQPVFVSSDVTRLDVGRQDHSRPTKLTHVVLRYRSKTDAELAFFIEALGFRRSN